MEPPVEFIKNIIKVILIVTVLILYTGPVFSFIHKGLSSTPNTPNKILFTLDASEILNGREVAVASALSTLPKKSRVAAIEPHILSYTDSGFAPREYVATLGEELTFINRSSKAMRIAIEPVENKKDSSAITESASIGNGGTYTVTIGTAGNFRFYNMNAKEDTGVIMVR